MGQVAWELAAGSRALLIDPMKSKYFVTCVCPTYGRPLFVEQAVKLFLRQTWGNSELLILDDSPKELQTQVKDSARIKVYRLGERLSMGDKHNLGLEVAQGEFLAHWDDDDWQSPLRLIRQVETLVLEPIDICGYEIDCLMTTRDVHFWRFDRTYGRGKALVGNATVPVGVPFMDGTAMVRREVIGGASYPSIPVGQKVVFLHDLWKKAGARLKALRNCGIYVYVRHDRKSGVTNTWQYGRDRRLLPIEKPAWFPHSELGFYQGVA